MRQVDKDSVEAWTSFPSISLYIGTTTACQIPAITAERNVTPTRGALVRELIKQMLLRISMGNRLAAGLTFCENGAMNWDVARDSNFALSKI